MPWSSSAAGDDDNDNAGAAGAAASAPPAHPASWPARTVARLKPGVLLVLFVIINIINYLDRGIVPGAFESLSDFIRTDLGTEDVDTQIGLLQSLFVVGYAVASLSFGHLVRSQPPFQVMAFGLAIWCFAVGLSGLAPHFWVLCAARCLSGVGEASFQLVVPPWIDDNAPPAQRGLWLSLFFTAIPFGTAIGYAWGGNIALALSWRWAFWLEVLPMLPLVPLVYFVPYTRSRREAKALASALAAGAPLPLLRSSSARRVARPEAPTVLGSNNGVVNDDAAGLRMSLLAHEASTIKPALSADEAAAATPGSAVEATTFLQLLGNVLLSNRLFMLVVFGYAGYTAVLAGLGSFGPTIVQGLGLFDTQASASLAFGGAVSLAGAVGTPLGGYLLDHFTQRRRRIDALKLLEAVASARRRAAELVATGGLGGAEMAAAIALAEAAAHSGPTSGRERTTTEAAAELVAASESTDASTIDIKLNVALPQAVAMTAVGCALCMAGIGLGTENSVSFLTLLSLGALCLCSTTAGVNVAIMASVDPDSRSFAIGLGTLLTHAFGDVPAPPIIGAIADRLSPQTCPPSGTAGPCHRSAWGLQVTLLLTLCWLVWPMLLWAGAWREASRRYAAHAKERTDSVVSIELLGK